MKMCTMMSYLNANRADRTVHLGSPALVLVNRDCHEILGSVKGLGMNWAVKTGGQSSERWGPAMSGLDG